MPAVIANVAAGMPPAAPALPPEISKIRRSWITLMLALVAFLAATDRNILAVLLVPIQRDLHVGDTAMGALTGLAYALVYATIALPMAQIAERANRRNFLVAAVAGWSVMTALCGLAGNYVQLLLARFGVAAGEAASTPTGLSMIADVYPPTKRGAAIGVITIGSALGFSAGAFIAGALNQRYGWHAAMLAVGLPGLAVAVLVRLSVPEPQRGAHDRHALPPLPMIDGLRRLLAIRTFWPLALGMVFLNIAFLGFLGWLPTFFLRVHHLSTSSMGAMFGLIVGVGGVAANAIAGPVSDLLSRRGARWRMYYCVAMGVISTPLMLLGLAATATPIAVAVLIAYTLAAGGLTTVTYASMISIAPSNLRATIMAVTGLAVTVFGAGFGPLLIGLLNDACKGAFGELAVRYTMMSGPVGLLVASVMFFIAGRTIEADCAEATGEPASPNRSGQ